MKEPGDDGAPAGSDNWGRVKAVFLEALDLPDVERPAFVARACGRNDLAGASSSRCSKANREAGSHERSNYIAYLAVEPGHEPLRGDPRFTSLLQRAGLE